MWKTKSKHQLVYNKIQTRKNNIPYAYSNNKFTTLLFSF